MSLPARALLLPLLLFAALPALARAQEAPAPEAEPPPLREEDGVSIDFTDTELADVIAAISRITGKNFLYDDRVRGRVTIVSPRKVTVDEAYRVFESILQVKGFTTVTGPAGVIKIIPIREAKESAIRTEGGERPIDDRDRYITRLIPLEFVKAETLAPTLRQLVSKDATLIAYQPTNTLILIDTAANIRRLLTIVSEVDVQTYQDRIKIFQIQHADAAELTEQLKEIFEVQDAGAGGAAPPATAAARRRAAARLQQQAVPVEGAGVTEFGGAAGQPRFITDERTNSIIAIAPKAVLKQVADLVDLLDYRRKGSGRIHVFRLQNADAEEMAETLASLTQGGPGGGAGGGGGVAGAAAAQAAAAVAELEGGVRITADPPTNSLIIQASSEGFTAIRDVIEALDVRRPQVMVEALIMEVGVDDSFALGGGFLFQQLLGGKQGTRQVIGSNTAGEAVGDLLGAGIGGGPFGDPGVFASAILGRTITVLDPDDPNGTTSITLPVIQGVIVASAQDSDTNIISAPVILTADNEEAEIIVGTNIPIPTSRLQATTTGVVGDPNTSSPFQTSQNIERQDVGVTLRVTPQISEGDSVRLDIFQQISEVDPTEQILDPTLGPTTTNRQVENTVYVRDGEAVMIGGILSETQGEAITKVPFLGDIPILGWAFRSTSDTSRKINLIVILTPHIVRDPQDLNRLTVENREKFRAYSGDPLQWTEKEREAQEKAREAGLDLPLDPNPVRRELEGHQKRYPVEELPEMRKGQEERESARVEGMEAAKQVKPGAYLVQVSSFRKSEEAVALLQKLIDEGYAGSLLSRQEGGEEVHYVQLGPYAEESRAQHVAREIRVEHDLEAVVIIQP